jgi:hypothetical protein
VLERGGEENGVESSASDVKELFVGCMEVRTDWADATIRFEGEVEIGEASCFFDGEREPFFVEIVLRMLVSASEAEPVMRVKCGWLMKNVFKVKWCKRTGQMMAHWRALWSRGMRM